MWDGFSQSTDKTCIEISDFFRRIEAEFIRQEADIALVVIDRFTSSSQAPERFEEVHICVVSIRIDVESLTKCPKRTGGLIADERFICVLG